MKLLELIVKNVKREDIPADAKWFMQDGDGEIKSSSSNKPPEINARVWMRNSSNTRRVMWRFGKLSEDWNSSIITREELMGAYNLIEQGYQLWFGGELPKDIHGNIDYVYSSGVKVNNIPAKNLIRAESVVIAWRLHKSQEEKFIDALEKVGSGYDDKMSEIRLAHDKLINSGYHGSCDDDEINHPSHYTIGNIECIDIIREMVRGKSEMEAACIANIVKYLYRYQDKGGIKSVEKAQWYLNLMVEEMKNEK